MRERNAIRYMAEYVAVKLLKRYKKPSTHPQVDFKWKLFVRVLKKMSAAGQPETLDSTRLHTSVVGVDRPRGLYHISDEVRIIILVYS